MTLVRTRRSPATLREAWIALVGLSAVFLFEMLDNSVLNVALPTIGRDLQAGTTGLQWGTGVYSVVFGGLMLLFGAIADRVGRRRVMLVGLVLLAHAPTAVQEEVLGGRLRRWTPHTVTDPAHLRAVLADVRRTDVAISDRQVTDDAVSVACPVRGADDRVVAALSVVFHAEGPVSAQAIAPALRAASRTISRLLGSPTARQQPRGSRRRPGGG